MYIYICENKFSFISVFFFHCLIPHLYEKQILTVTFISQRIQLCYDEQRRWQIGEICTQYTGAAWIVIMNIEVIQPSSKVWAMCIHVDLKLPWAMCIHVDLKLPWAMCIHVDLKLP